MKLLELMEDQFPIIADCPRGLCGGPCYKDTLLPEKQGVNGAENCLNENISLKKKKGNHASHLRTGLETEPQIPLTYYVVREDVCAAQKAGGYVRMGESLHIPVLAAICRRLLGNPYKLQTQQVWVTLSHPASPTEFCSHPH